MFISNQDTPNPGTYEVVDFIDELNKKVVPQSYRFKDQGRKKDADPSRKGVMLLPGQYKYQTFVDDLRSKQCYASFKASKRFNGPGVAGLVDKVYYAMRGFCDNLIVTVLRKRELWLKYFFCKPSIAYD